MVDYGENNERATVSGSNVAIEGHSDMAGDMPATSAANTTVELQTRSETRPNVSASTVRARRGRGRGTSSRENQSRATGSGRGTSRRGRNRGSIRGSQRQGTWDPSSGWRLNATYCNHIIMEDEFAERVIYQRSRMLCSSAVDKMKQELQVRGITATRAGFGVLFADALLHQLREWLNGFIRLQGIEEDCVTMSDMYKYLSVLLLSHTTGFSFSTAISLLRQSGSVAPSLDRIRFIADNVLAFSATGRGQDGGIQWDSQRDKTRQLTEFENLAFRDTRKVFFSPLYPHATLDDDLFGSRASDNQVKMLSNRKEDKEGHSADAVADAYFRVLLAIRFRRRGETQVESVRKLVTKLVDGRGEESLNGCIVTADTGYGKEAFTEILMEFGLASVFVMPDHLLRVHPLVAASYLNPYRGDHEEFGIVANTETDETENLRSINQQTEREIQMMHCPSLHGRPTEGANSL